jgi:hypothetical protein
MVIFFILYLEDSLTVNLSKDCLRPLMAAVLSLMNLNKYEYQRMRPFFQAPSKEIDKRKFLFKALWYWACACMVLERRKRRLSKERFKERITDKKRYIRLRKSLLKLIDEKEKKEKKNKNKNKNWKEELYQTLRCLWDKETKKSVKKDRIKRTQAKGTFKNEKIEFIYSSEVVKKLVGESDSKKKVDKEKKEEKGELGELVCLELKLGLLWLCVCFVMIMCLICYDYVFVLLCVLV